MISDNSDLLIPFSCDLHLHSALSPCAEDKMTPKEVVKKIITLGIEIFSITDHNAGFNCQAFEGAANDHNLLFIPGIELQTSEEIHLLGYFPDIKTLNSFCSTVVKPGIPSQVKNDPLRFGHQLKLNNAGKVMGEEKGMLIMPLNLPIDKLVDKIHMFNGVAVAAHIDREFSVISQLGYLPPQLKIDAVEVFNISKIDSIQSKFLKDGKLEILSSSDSHYLDMMKLPKMKFWLKNVDVQDCLNCIRGTGGGRITISSAELRKSKTIDGKNFQTNDGTSPRDWKNLYNK